MLTSASAKDVGILIRDLCEDHSIDLFDWSAPDPAATLSFDHVEVVDVSDAAAPIFHLAGGQKFKVHITPIE